MGATRDTKAGHFQVGVMSQDLAAFSTVCGRASTHQLREGGVALWAEHRVHDINSHILHFIRTADASLVVPAQAPNRPVMPRFRAGRRVSLERVSTAGRPSDETRGEEIVG